MKPTEQKKFTKGIVDTLRTRGTYDKAVDDVLIDNLIFNLVLIENAKKDIVHRGQMVDIGKNNEFFQINFSVSIFHNAVKSVNAILKQLGLEKMRVEVDPRDTTLNQLNEIITR